MTTATTAWASLDYDPKEAPSTVNGTEYTTQVDKDGEKVRIYYKIGGLCDFLKKGDTVMLEFIKGKWKLGKTQTPELLKTLEQRRGTSAPAAPSDAPPMQSNEYTTDGAGRVNDVAEMARIVIQLQKALPELEHQAIASLACTIYIGRTKR